MRWSPKFTSVATFARVTDATSYTAGDAVTASNTVAGFLAFPDVCHYPGAGGYVVGASVLTNKRGITPRVRCHLYNTNTSSVGFDNGGMVEAYVDNPNRLGYFDLNAMTSASSSDMSRTFDYSTLRHPFITAVGTSTLWGMLETLDAFGPNSGQLFSVRLMTEVDR